MSEEQASSSADLDTAGQTGEGGDQQLQNVRLQTLPFPLPVPAYSQTIQVAQATGNVLTERATIIRETVKYFLTFKYWWTSEDYDRIAELVVTQFPQLRDPDATCAESSYSKVRLDLSMCARNFRRIAKNQKRRSSVDPASPSTVLAKAGKRAVKVGKQPGTKRCRVGELNSSAECVFPDTQALTHATLSMHPTTTIRHKQLGDTSSTLSGVSSSPTVLPPVAHFLVHQSGHGESSSVLSSVLEPKASMYHEGHLPARKTSKSQSNKRPLAADLPNQETESLSKTDNSLSVLAAWRPLDAQVVNHTSLPAYSIKESRIRADLSQAVSNIRRHGTTHRKQEESHSPSTVTKEAPEFAQPATDFCNELLAAASIIESRGAQQQDNPGEHFEQKSNMEELDVASPCELAMQAQSRTSQKRGAMNSAKEKLAVESTKHSAEYQESGRHDEGRTSMSVKQEVENEHLLEQLQLYTAQQAWLNSQITQSLSFQAFTGLSVAQISEHGKLVYPPAAHQPALNSVIASSASHTADCAGSSEAMAAPFTLYTPVSGDNSMSSPALDRSSSVSIMRSTCLPDPLPLPPYTLNVLRAKDAGNSSSAKTRIIRETTQFFLSLKMWWTPQDYERITELVMQQFPDLPNMVQIKKDLGTCARNMRRRLSPKGLKDDVPAAGTKIQANGSEGDSTRLGELATMAVRDAQDKGSHEASALVNTKQKLSPYLLMEQAALASDPASSFVYGAINKQSLSDASQMQTYYSQMQEAQNSIHNSMLQSGTDRVKCRRKKTEKTSRTKGRPVSEDQAANSVLMPQEQKLPPDFAAQAAQMAALAADAALAHNGSALFTHAQSFDPLAGPHTASLEEELPINLSFAPQDALKKHKPPKTDKSKIKGATSNDPSAGSREQVWLPHGSPYKKGGQKDIKPLPTPLPVPRYSQKLLKAHEDGTANRHRSEIIRETARFFLELKYWWSSADYSAISELVVQQFPELYDVDSFTYKKVQRDLSMCARNLRRKNRHHQIPCLDVSPPAGGYFVSAVKRVPEGHVKPKRIKQVNIKQELVEKENVEEAGGEHSAMVVATVNAAGVPASVTHTQESEGTLYQHSAASVKPQSESASLISSSSREKPASVAVSCVMLPHLDPDPQSKFIQSALDKNSVVPSAACLESSAGSALHVVSLPSFHAKAPDAKEASDAKGRGTLSKHKSVKGAAKTTSRVNPQLHKSEIHGEMNVNGDPSCQARTTAVITPTIALSHNTSGVKYTDSVYERVYINTEHGSSLQSQLTKLWQEGKFFDASLEVDDQRLPVHKLILLAASPYLQSTYRHANPTAHLEVNLPRETGISAAKDFLKYMYEGVLHVTPHSVGALRRIAAMLQINQLLAYCDEYLHWLASVTNVAHHVTSLPLTAVPHYKQVLPRPSSYIQYPAQPVVTTSSLNGPEDAKHRADSNGPVHFRTYSASDILTFSNGSSLHVPRSLPSNAHTVDSKGRREHVSLEMLMTQMQAGLHSEPMCLLEEQVPMETVSVTAEPAVTVEVASHGIHQHVSEADLELLNAAQLSEASKHLDSDCTHISSVGMDDPSCANASSQVVGSADGCVKDGEEESYYSQPNSKHILAMDYASASGMKEETVTTLLAQVDSDGKVEEDGEIVMQCLPMGEAQFSVDEQMVKEVVIDAGDYAGDLLHDVEVAACETVVGCSLLPQTYCSSPEDTNSLCSQADTTVQNIASQWAKQYAQNNTPLDSETAEQFAAVLQERMYAGRSISSCRASSPEDKGLVLQCRDDSTGQSASPSLLNMVDPRQRKISADLNVMAKNHEHILPQTYCSSPVAVAAVTSD